MTIEEAESERDRLVWAVKLSDIGGTSRTDYLNGWIDCYNQLNKPETPLKVKDFPKELRKEIKKEVKRQGNDWVDRKEKPLINSFSWFSSKKGHYYWCEIYNKYYGV